MRLGPSPWATDDLSNLDQTAVPRGSFPNEIPVGGGSVATACSGTGAGTVIGGYAKYVDSMRLGRKFDGRGLFLLCGESFPVLLVTFESYFESFEMSLWKDSGIWHPIEICFFPVSGSQIRGNAQNQVAMATRHRLYFVQISCCILNTGTNRYGHCDSTSAGTGTG